MTATRYPLTYPDFEFVHPPYRQTYGLYAAGFHCGDALEVLAKARRFLRTERESWRIPSRVTAYQTMRAVCMKPARLPA